MAHRRIFKTNQENDARLKIYDKELYMLEFTLNGLQTYKLLLKLVKSRQCSTTTVRSDAKDRRGPNWKPHKQNIYKCSQCWISSDLAVHRQTGWCPSFIKQVQLVLGYRVNIMRLASDSPVKSAKSVYRELLNCLVKSITNVYQCCQFDEINWL